METTVEGSRVEIKKTQFQYEKTFDHKDEARELEDKSGRLHIA